MGSGEGGEYGRVSGNSMIFKGNLVKCREIVEIKVFKNMKESIVQYTSTYKVDVEQLEISITSLVMELCMVEHNWDKATVDKL